MFNPYDNPKIRKSVIGIIESESKSVEEIEDEKTELSMQLSCGEITQQEYSAILGTLNIKEDRILKRVSPLLGL